MKIKHSKYKNTGILFEVLMKQITSDTLKGVDSPATQILKEHFFKSELGKEYRLYDALLKSQNLNITRANTNLNTILESYSKINKKTLRNEKYNLVKDIKKHYNINEVFNIKVEKYRELASLYTILESQSTSQLTDINQISNSKSNLLEYMTLKPHTSSSNEGLGDFNHYDKDVRMLTYKILLEKFNTKYDGLSTHQKEVLREFINSVDSTPQLKNFYNNKIITLRKSILGESKKVTCSSTKIKIKEVLKFLTPLDKNYNISTDNMVDLLQFCELHKELTNV